MISHYSLISKQNFLLDTKAVKRNMSINKLHLGQESLFNPIKLVNSDNSDQIDIESNKLDRSNG